MILPDPPGSFDPAAAVALNRTAVVSLVLSLVFCCPLTSLAAVATGLVALLGSGRALAGRWMAVVGILIGAGGLALQGAGSVIGYRVVVAPILSGPQEALRAGQSGDIAGLCAAFVAPAAGTDGSEAAARAFVDALRARYGSFNSAALDQNSAPAAAPANADRFEGEYMLDFDKGRLRARCAIQLADGSQRLSMKLISIEIIDPKLGNISFPAGPTAPATPEEQSP